LSRRFSTAGFLLASLLGAAPPAAAQFFRGVNISGAEFGQTHLPGVYNTDYTYNSELTFRYFAARNLNLVRFPLQWERLQPVLRGPLDPQNLSLLKGVVSWAKADGNLLILDIHNYARYSINENGKLNTYVIDQPVGGVVKVSRDDLIDLWVRLSDEFASEPAVYAYDLMNEPHDLTGWKDISQAVLTAIRQNGDDKLVMVPGDSWSSANRWQSVHGPAAWITDPANNFLYEAHQYFDSDESGTYSKSYDTELAANPNLATVGSTRVQHFLDWCHSNNVRGYLGEFGVPDTDSRWWAVLDDFLQTLDAAGMSSSYWAAGEWWGTYALSVQPLNSYTVDRVQMPYLLAHLPPGSFTSVSAASNGSPTFAPGSLMAGYGTGLSPGTDQAASLPWPTSLKGVMVQLTDSAGGIFNAPLTYVSPGQIDYLIPAEAALGRVNIQVLAAGQVLARGSYVLERVAPTLFSANGSAGGPAAALIQRVKADGTVTYEYTSAGPIDFGDAADRLFLVLFGTGFRNPASPSRTALSLGSTTLSIAYQGPQPDTPGLDQINAELPRSLVGAGQVAVTLQVDGKSANPVTLGFK